MINVHVLEVNDPRRAALEKMMEKQARMESMSEAKQNDSREKMEKADQYYKTGSIAERARMV